MMRRGLRRSHGWSLPLVAIAASLLLIGVALAQSASGYDLSWRTIAGGSNTSGGSYQVRSVIGQPLTAHSAGGSYAIDSGFLGGAAPVKFKRTLPQLANDGAN
jgi:hypothetical protein